MQRRIKLLHWRIEKNLKQRDICEALEVSRGHYSNIERGLTDPSFELLIKFRNIYEVADTLSLFEKGVVKNGDNNPSRVIN